MVLGVAYRAGVKEHAFSGVFARSWTRSDSVAPTPR